MKKDVVFIRHAESMFNNAAQQFRVEHSLPYAWSDLCKNERFLLEVKYNPDFLDCAITERGIQQCLKAQHKTHDIYPDVILVSPLNRTLQTCSNIFGDTDIPVFVEPILGQALRSSCDISESIDSKIQNYPKYEFEPLKQAGDLWFISNESDQNQKRYKSVLKLLNDQTHEEKRQAILKLMTEERMLEAPINIRQRVQKVKEKIGEYREKYDKVAVVAHYNIIKYTCSQNFDQNHQPADLIAIDNCQIYETCLEDLLKYS